MVFFDKLVIKILCYKNGASILHTLFTLGYHPFIKQLSAATKNPGKSIATWREIFAKNRVAVGRTNSTAHAWLDKLLQRNSQQRVMSLQRNTTTDRLLRVRK
jgi:hypothetical protein